MPKNVFSILDDLAQGIEELRAALAPLAAISAKPIAAAKPRGSSRKRVAPAKTEVVREKTSVRPTRRATSPKVKALRVLQGKFLGTIRGLNPQQREQIKKVREEKGYDAAIKAAATLGK